MTRQRSSTSLSISKPHLFCRPIRSSNSSIRWLLQLGGHLVFGLGPLVLAALVGEDVEEGEAVGDAQDEKEPEEVEGLQGTQQRERDDEGERALELARLPVGAGLVGADRLELGEEAKEDAQVEVVAQVDPHAHEEEVVRARQDVVEVVEGFGGLLREEKKH